MLNFFNEPWFYSKRGFQPVNCMQRTVFLEPLGASSDLFFPHKSYNNLWSSIQPMHCCWAHFRASSEASVALVIPSTFIYLFIYFVLLLLSELYPTWEVCNFLNRIGMPFCLRGLRAAFHSCFYFAAASASIFTL